MRCLRGTGFVDLRGGAWYLEDVMQAADLGIVSGVSEAFFEPLARMDRAMFATVLYKAAGGEDASPESLPFEDIRPEDWYAEAVSWAYDNGVVQGISDTEFAPLSRVTREQAATMMIQYLESQGVFSEAEEPDFTDADQISAYARTLGQGTGPGHSSRLHRRHRGPSKHPHPCRRCNAADEHALLLGGSVSDTANRKRGLMAEKHKEILQKY